MTIPPPRFARCGLPSVGALNLRRCKNPGVAGVLQIQLRGGKEVLMDLLTLCLLLILLRSKHVRFKIEIDL